MSIDLTLPYIMQLESKQINDESAEKEREGGGIPLLEKKIN